MAARPASPDTWVCAQFHGVVERLQRGGRGHVDGGQRVDRRPHRGELVGLQHDQGEPRAEPVARRGGRGEQPRKVGGVELDAGQVVRLEVGVESFGSVRTTCRGSKPSTSPGPKVCTVTGGTALTLARVLRGDVEADGERRAGRAASCRSRGCRASWRCPAATRPGSGAGRTRRPSGPVMPSPPRALGR